MVSKLFSNPHFFNILLEEAEEKNHSSLTSLVSSYLLSKIKETWQKAEFEGLPKLLLV